jgi:hypothetical protein
VPGGQWLSKQRNSRHANHISVPMVGRGHRTVWCPPEKEGSQSDDSVTIADKDVLCALDCPVHPQIEGNQEFAKEGATTP